MNLPDWLGVEADTPEFYDKIAQALEALAHNERVMATYDGPTVEQSIRFALLRARERLMHGYGLCSKWGYTWLRP